MKWKMHSRTAVAVGSLAVLAACSGTNTAGPVETAAAAVDQPVTSESVAAEPAHTAADPHWTYEGAEGPEHWGELAGQYEACAVGTHQSPIDLTSPVFEDAPSIEFSYRSEPVSILNNGHTVQVTYPEGSSITLGDKVDPLAQYHFHAPSEHTIAGTSYPAELHIVHKLGDNDYAVVGILLTEGAANPALEPVLANLPAVPADTPTVVGGNPTVNAADFLPADRTSYRYTGSLTTPPCTEGVNWVVMANPVEVSAEQIAALTAVLPDNNSPLQPVNDRTLVEDGTA